MIEIKKTIINKKNILNILLIASIFLADRFSKIKIINHILDNNSSIYVNDYLNLDLVWNTGIGFGLFDFDSGKFYHLITIIIFFVILVLVFFIIKSKKFDKFLYSMILGGALGNFYDRVLYFSVPDFIDFHISNYHWFTFNIADIFISVGVVLILTKEFFLKKNENN
jgi:signal peptidase II